MELTTDNKILVVEPDYLLDLYAGMPSPLLSGVRGKCPRREIFWENFLVKYCNFVVNLDCSL